MFLIIIGKHVFFKRDFCTISLQTSLPRRVRRSWKRSFPFFRIAFDCTLRTKLDQPKFLARGRKMMDGSRAENDLSVSRSLGNVGMQTTHPRIVKVSLKAKRRF